MSARLRRWADTGHYRQDDDLAFEGPGHTPSGSSEWRENAKLVALVPVGIVFGILFAVAFTARLVAYPLTRRGAAATEGDDYPRVA